jgi:hypothetical protein
VTIVCDAILPVCGLLAFGYAATFTRVFKRSIRQNTCQLRVLFRDPGGPVSRHGDHLAPPGIVWGYLGSFYLGARRAVRARDRDRPPCVRRVVRAPSDHRPWLSTNPAPADSGGSDRLRRAGHPAAVPTARVPHRCYSPRSQSFLRPPAGVARACAASAAMPARRKARPRFCCPASSRPRRSLQCWRSSMRKWGGPRRRDIVPSRVMSS